MLIKFWVLIFLGDSARGSRQVAANPEVLPSADDSTPRWKTPFLYLKL